VRGQVNRLDGLQHMHIPPGQTYVSPGEAYVEGDASSASYFLAGALCLDLARQANS
jgi:3-phosphoshikimate 1-carboxyvinyltransferase